jgi:hypothetical protein
MDQHISRLDTNTDDSGQQPNHGVGPGLRLLLQCSHLIEEVRFASDSPLEGDGFEKVS